MTVDLNDEPAIIGRSLHDIEKYGTDATAYIAKTVMSTGQKPVLGRKILCDISKPHVVLICGKRGGGKCLDGETEIVLEDGSIKKIKDLEFDARNVMSLDKEYKIRPAFKSNFYKRNVSKMLELTLNSGKTIRLTPEHPLLTIDGWKPAQELAKNSLIATPRKINAFGNSFLTESEIKLLSYLLAEGHTKRKVVWFTNSDKQIQDEFISCVTQFDQNLEVKRMDKYGFRAVRNEETRRFPKNRHSLRQFLIQHNAYDLLAKEKTIPQIIFSLPKPKLALFLNRLFSCDGSIYFESNRWRISYSSASEKLAKQVQHLLLRFEVISRARNKITKLNYYITF